MRISSIHPKIDRMNSSDYWVSVGRRKALLLFHQASRRVPAYKDFLRKNHIYPEKIRTWLDFQQIPSIDKQNYLKKYPLHLKCWDGTLAKPLVFTSTSGSTGEPTYFPRGRKLDLQYSYILEEFIRNSSYGYSKPTLVIICFGMGVWIGGLITYQAFEVAANRGKLPISILTPGINKEEIFKSLKLLAPNFEQVIMVGYAPFIKDVLHEAINRGIDVQEMNIRFLFAAEAISEKFRDYIHKIAPKINIYRDTLNIYGSADIGAMAHEGPMGIFVKRLVSESSKFRQSLLNNVSKTPSIAQYNPRFIQFESINGTIVLSGDNSIPLIRYSIGDHGGVFSYTDLISLIEKSKVRTNSIFRTNGISTKINQLPFVYVYERSDLSTTLYGINLYPEYVREAILHKSLVRQLTGKFVMVTNFDQYHNQILTINIELSKNSRYSRKLLAITEKIIHQVLLLRSSEFKELTKFVKHRKLIRVKLYPQESPKYFKVGIKQRWVIKER